MSEWNAMTFEGKDTILRVVREQAASMFAMIEDPATWEAPTACAGWTTRDVVGHIVDTTEGYFRAFDAARGEGTVPEAHGLTVMAELANQGATSFRSVPQKELVQRLHDDFETMQAILAPLDAEDWTGMMVTHAYMGPVPAFFFAAGQLMDYGVHTWDLREGLGMVHALNGDVADLLVPFMFALWQGTCRTDTVTDPFDIGIRVSGRNGGDYKVSVSNQGMGYALGDIDDLAAMIEFDAASLVLRTYNRMNSGTVRGDQELAERYLNLFFAI
jgi:uncharacterized protein (TIGR03083 family)